MKLRIELPGYYNHGYADIEHIWINEECILENNLLYTEKEYMSKEPTKLKFVFKEAVPMANYDLVKITVQKDGRVALVYQGPKSMYVFGLMCLKRMILNDDIYESSEEYTKA